MVLRVTNHRVNSFKDIADRHANTKPIRGTSIIPIGGRAYGRREYILKRSKTHYDMVLQGEVLVSWEMKGDIEVITIRNNGYTDCYTFLDNLLPHDLRFFILEGSGRQYISMNRKRHKHSNYDEDREWTVQGDGEKDFYLPKYLDKPLQFARKHAKWQHIGREYIFRHAMTQVNKDAKAEIKPYADKFYEWITTMYAMLPVHDWDYRVDMEKEFNQYFVTNNIDDTIEEYKNIMRDENHPMRLHLAVEYLRHSPLYGYGGVIPIETKEKASKVRSNWNRWLNKSLGLSKNIHESRTEEVK
tara:strand:+ start:2162 stop:3061 length:900 start_codon:yes stop_codon:yes gene_type:complete